jgi:hypothetical protein
MAGRPKLYDWFLTVGFTDQQAAFIELTAAEQGVAYGEIVRNALQSVMNGANTARTDRNQNVVAM